MNLQQRLDALIQVLGADHKSQQTSINNLIGAIGTLSSLSTTDKSNIVAAINEIYAMAQASSGVINDSLSTSTSKTYSIDKIKSEILSANNTLKSELLGGVPQAAWDTIAEIANYISSDQTATSGLIASVGNRVSYTQADGKSASEKLQARQNIDAYGSVELGNPDTDLVTLYNLAKA